MMLFLTKPIRNWVITFIETMESDFGMEDSLLVVHVASQRGDLSVLRAAVPTAGERLHQRFLIDFRPIS